MSVFDPLTPDELPESAGHTLKYFNERGIRLDCRGTLQIHPESRWGFFINVITLSHYRGPGDKMADGALADRPVIVGRDAWICSGATLYNCIIGEGAIVSVGTVVRSQEVKPFVMVAGNPAKVIARYTEGQWQYINPKWEILE